MRIDFVHIVVLYAGSGRIFAAFAATQTSVNIHPLQVKTNHLISILLGTLGKLLDQSGGVSVWTWASV